MWLRPPRRRRKCVGRNLFPLGRFVLSLFFVICTFDLVLLATLNVWQGLQLDLVLAVPQRLRGALECMALLTLAVAALELSSALRDETVKSASHMSVPTSAKRRYDGDAGCLPQRRIGPKYLLWITFSLVSSIWYVLDTATGPIRAMRSHPVSSVPGGPG